MGFLTNTLWYVRLPDLIADLFFLRPHFITLQIDRLESSERLTKRLLVCVYVCVCERERESVCESVRVCVCECVRMCVCMCAQITVMSTTCGHVILGIALLIVDNADGYFIWKSSYSQGINKPCSTASQPKLHTIQFIIALQCHPRLFFAD